MATAEWRENNREHVRKYKRGWYKKNREKVIDEVIERKLQSVSFAREQKRKGCSRCPEKDIRCLDFHHIKPKEKKGSISKLAASGLSKKSLLKEIEKCEILCANCHRKEHASFV